MLLIHPYPVDKSHEILPNSGSLAGGSILKISGEGYSRNQKENLVDLCGVKCDVLSSNATTIMCLTRSTLDTVKENTISSVSATTDGFTSIYHITTSGDDIEEIGSIGEVGYNKWVNSGEKNNDLSRYSGRKLTWTINGNGRKVRSKLKKMTKVVNCVHYNRFVIIVVVVIFLT